MSWTVVANQEFKEMENATGLSFHGQFGGDLWLDDELFGYTEYSEEESEGGTRRLVVSYQYLLHCNANQTERGVQEEQLLHEESSEDGTCRPSSWNFDTNDDVENEQLPPEESTEDGTCRPSIRNFDTNDDVEFSEC